MVSSNNVKIAGHKLQWVWVNGRNCKLVDEDGRTLYYIAKLYDAGDKPVRDEKNRQQYQVHIGGFDGEVLGNPEPYMPCAKSVAERHFGELHGGKFEGHWSKR